MALRIPTIESLRGAQETAYLRQLGLPKFETLDDVQARNLTMSKRLLTHGFDDIGAKMNRCRVDSCSFFPCVEGCHLASRQRRLETLSTAVPIFSAHRGPIHAVTIVHPRWELTAGRLADFNIAAVRQWNARRLNNLPGLSVIALGIVEVTWNVERDGSGHWAGEIQQVVAGATKEQLWDAFADVPRRAPHARPVMVSSIRYLPRKLAYAQKHLVEQRIAFTSEVNGRQARRHMPPPHDRWAEHDAWLCGLPVGARTLTFGLARVGQRVFTRS